MRLQGRLTGQFLSRVIVLIGFLGVVFLGWLVWVTMQSGDIHYSTPSPVEVLRAAAAETTLTAEGQVAVTETGAAAVREGGFWLQVLDEGGSAVAAVDAPGDAPAHYTPGYLAYYHQTPSKIGQDGVYTWVADVGGRSLTLVLGDPKGAAPRNALYFGPVVTEPESATISDLLVLVVAGGVAILVVAAVFARSLVRPMNHMMRWLGELAAGRFAEPTSRAGRPLSRSRDGRSRRRPFRTYREVFDSLDSLTSELGRAQAERQSVEAAREEWIAGVTHDLRTPLTSVRGYADLLASDYETPSEEVRRQAEIIAAQANHMEALIDDLTLTFRLSADALPLQRERVDLIEFVRERAVELANDPRAVGREVIFEEPAGAGSIDVDIDPGLLRRAVANLLTNAALHNPGGTTVRVSVAREGVWAIVLVADDGSGMDAETLGRLFDRYYRGTSTTSGSEGSGLGMAISRQIVEAHGGSVRAWSEAGAGTEVTLRLPTA